MTRFQVGYVVVIHHSDPKVEPEFLTPVVYVSPQLAQARADRYVKRMNKACERPLVLPAYVEVPR